MKLILIPSWGMRMCSDLLPWFATKLLWKELKNIYRPLNIRIIWKISPLSVEKGVISSQYARFLFRYSFKMYQKWQAKHAIPAITKICLDQFSWLATIVFLKRMEEMYCPESVRKIWQRKYTCIDKLASASPSFFWNFIMTGGKRIGNEFTRIGT